MENKNIFENENVKLRLINLSTIIKKDSLLILKVK